MTNSADPDHLASSEAATPTLLQKPTDLDLHCLLRQGILCLAREVLKFFQLSRTNPSKHCRLGYFGEVCIVYLKSFTALSLDTFHKVKKLKKLYPRNIKQKNS